MDEADDESVCASLQQYSKTRLGQSEFYSTNKGMLAAEIIVDSIPIRAGTLTVHLKVAEIFKRDADSRDGSY